MKIDFLATVYGALALRVARGRFILANAVTAEHRARGATMRFSMYRSARAGQPAIIV